mmetsp:Transcript_1895/g.3986  ORF Transcript_1895/g.3986 Transcript_1895/m.3986 type:complete len:91 (+) Transcript_1895:2029-2301(+)
MRRLLAVPSDSARERGGGPGEETTVDIRHFSFSLSSLLFLSIASQKPVFPPRACTRKQTKREWPFRLSFQMTDEPVHLFKIHACMYVACA